MLKHSNLHFALGKNKRWLDLIDGALPLPDEVKNRTKSGNDIWVALSYLHLKKNGYDVSIGRDAKEDKINVISGVTAGTKDINPNCYYVTCRNDSHYPALGQTVLHQNLIRTNKPGEIYVPQWPQPGIIPRDPQREGSIQSVAYFGQPKRNLAAVFQTDQFKEALAQRGIEFIIKRKYKGEICWHDYSNVDIVLAVREKIPAGLSAVKPVNKVTNSWLANCLCITGAEPPILAAFPDCEATLMAETVEDVLKIIDNLTSNPDQYEALLQQGRVLAEDYTEEHVLNCWIKMEQEINPDFEAWKAKSKLSKLLSFAQRSVLHRMSKRHHKKTVTQLLDK